MEDLKKKNKRILLKPKKPNGFEENPTEPKKADNDDDNEDEEDDEVDNDLLSKEEKEEKLQQRFIECLNSFNTNAIDECISYLDDLSFSVIESVLEKTSRISNPNWGYAKVILDDYVQRKIDTLEKVKADNINYKTKNSLNTEKQETEQEKIARKTKALEEAMKNANW